MAEPDPGAVFAQLVGNLDPPGRLLRWWPLAGGSSARTTALEIAFPDGNTGKLIVRQPSETTLRRNPQAAAELFRLLAALQASQVPTPAPVHLDPSGPLLVLEYVEGAPDYAPANLSAYLDQYAATLAHIHRLDSSSPAFAALPQQAKRVAGRFRERPAALDETPAEERIRAALAATWPPPQTNSAALLHGDFWPGNTLWRNGRLVAVIDWEDAGLGDPLADLAISRLDLLWIFGEEAMRTFSDHYLSLATIDITSLPYWDLYASLRLASAIPSIARGWPGLGRSDISEQSLQEGRRWFAEQALGELQAR